MEIWYAIVYRFKVRKMGELIRKQIFEAKSHEFMTRRHDESDAEFLVRYKKAVNEA